MSRFFTSSVALGALAAMLASPVLAQQTPAAPATTPAAEAPAGPSVTLLQVLRDAGLTDVESKPGRHGSRVQGKLADGTELGAFLDGKGELRGLRAKGDGVLPQSLIEALVPQPVRSHAVFGELARINAVFDGPEGIILSGQDAQGKALRAGFAADGTLMRFGRGEPERRPMGDMRPGDRKDDDHGRGGPDGKGPRHEGPRHEGKGPRDHDRDRGDHDRNGPRGEDHGRRGGPAPQGDPLSPDQVRASLSDAGYTEVAEILQQGPITIARATNPEGEPVLVEVGVDGKILRELNR